MENENKNYFKYVRRYKKMKSITQICKENNIRPSNVEIRGKIKKEKQDLLIKEMKKEVIKLYNYLILGVEI